MADVFGTQKKPVHKQGPNWDVVGRYEEFDQADARRKKEIKDGRTAKVHKLSANFVVKVKPLTVTEKVVKPDVTVDTKKEKSPGKPKRQDRDNKR